eukprot:scaffold29_cov251-Pinguiococcus_pyrenoidosus.AAC.22
MGLHHPIQLERIIGHIHSIRNERAVFQLPKRENRAALVVRRRLPYLRNAELEVLLVIRVVANANSGLRPLKLRRFFVRTQKAWHEASDERRAEVLLGVAVPAVEAPD